MNASHMCPICEDPCEPARSTLKRVANVEDHIKREHPERVEEYLNGEL